MAVTACGVVGNPSDNASPWLVNPPRSMSMPRFSQPLARHASIRLAGLCLVPSGAAQTGGDR